jgi:hypothetical protein
MSIEVPIERVEAEHANRSRNSCRKSMKERMKMSREVQ